MIITKTIRRFFLTVFGILALIAACSKSEQMEPPEEYGVTDTVTEIYVSISPIWDFQNERPVIFSIGFHKYRFDSTFAWDPFFQQFVEWSGQPVKGWHYDYSEYGKYKIDFLTDSLINTAIPAYYDRGSLVYYEPNKDLVNKPIARIVDTVTNNIVATLLLGERSTIDIDLDPGPTIHPIPDRPSSPELAKTLNQCLKKVWINYQFEKFKPR